MPTRAPRAVVTGAGGFVGANLVRRLVADGFEVWCFSRDPERRPRLRALGERTHLVTCDVTDAAAVRRFVKEADPTVVFHLAGVPFNPPGIPARTHVEVAAGGAVNVLESADAGVRVVLTGSAAEYGGGSRIREDAPLRPGTVLGAAKAAASLLAQAYASARGLETVVLRLFTPFGPWEGAHRLVAHTTLSALRGEDVRISSGKQQRDYIFVLDVVEALVGAGTLPVPAGAAINVCSGRGVAVSDVAEMVLGLMGNPVRLLKGELPSRPDEIWEMSGDNRAAREILGWKPTTALDVGLRRSIEWITQNQKLAAELE